MPNMPHIELAKVEDLYLDPRNPRLGRRDIEKPLSQDELLKRMQDWALDELATSFLESGFWPQESLIAVRETIPESKTPVLVVVEGNRRLATLKLLASGLAGSGCPAKWKELLRSAAPELLSQLATIPYIEMTNRKSVQGYLGFRHVTGIKEWSPAEKAQFIAHLIEDEGLDYDQVRRKIGSKAPTVKQHYIAYRLLLQMEDETSHIDLDRVEDRFSVLYRSVRTAGIQRYLDLNADAAPKDALKPVPSAKLPKLELLTTWLFGTEKRPPVLADSRDLDEFGKVLLSETGLSYLERTANPNLESAKRAAGVSPSEVAENLELAASKLEDALAVVHQFSHDRVPRLQTAVRRVGKDALQLLSIFPEIESELQTERK